MWAWAEVRGRKVKRAPGEAPALEREDLLQAQRDRQIIEEQKTTQLVEARIRQARRELTGDPEGALELLRSTLVGVREHPDLGERIRNSLLGRLESTLRDLTLQGASVKLRRQEEQRRAAERDKFLTAETQRRQEEEQLEARFREYKSLMNIARFDADVADRVLQGFIEMGRDQIRKFQPVPPEVVAGYTQTLTANNLQKVNDLRRLKESRYLAAML